MEEKLFELSTIQSNSEDRPRTHQMTKDKTLKKRIQYCTKTNTKRTPNTNNPTNKTNQPEQKYNRQQLETFKNNK